MIDGCCCTVNIVGNFGLLCGPGTLGAVTRIRVGRWEILGSMPFRGTRFSSSPNCPDWLGC